MGEEAVFSGVAGNGVGRSILPKDAGNGVRSAILSSVLGNGAWSAMLSEAADVERKTDLCQAQKLANEPSAEERMANRAPKSASSESTAGHAPEPIASERMADPLKSPVLLSAKTGAGLDELISRVKDSVHSGLRERPPDVAINLRHKEALTRAREALMRFDKGCEDRLSQEFLAFELRDALDAVGEIVGRTTPEAILDKIFKDFCIGK